MRTARGDSREATCSKYAYTAEAVKASSPRPNCCRWPRSSRAATPRLSPPSARSAPGPGGLLLPRRRAADPDSRADRRAGRADHSGPDPASPGRCLWRPRPDGYILINTGRSFDELGLGEFVEGFPQGATADRPGHRDRPRAPRPAVAQRGPARRIRGAQRHRSIDVGGGAIRERFAGKLGDGNVAGAEAAFDYVRREVGGPLMLKQLEGSQAVAEAVAMCRPEVICRVPDLPADPHRRGALRPGPHR